MKIDFALFLLLKLYSYLKHAHISMQIVTFLRLSQEQDGDFVSGFEMCWVPRTWNPLRSVKNSLSEFWTSVEIFTASSRLTSFWISTKLNMSTVLPSTPVDMYNWLNMFTCWWFFLIQRSQAFYSTEKNYCKSHFCRSGSLTWRIVESDHVLDMVDENRDFWHHWSSHNPYHWVSNRQGL